MIVVERAKKVEGTKTEHPTRAKLSAQASLKGMRGFGKRREKFVATIREGKG
jgi:hypothetical protein